MKPRKILEDIENAIKLAQKKIVFIWGPRQIGKSTILNHLYKKYGGSYFNFDNIEDQRLFIPEFSKLISSIRLKSNRDASRFIFIDEVQKYPESTQSIKLLADSSEHIILATGSSEMRAKTNHFDTLAGRYREFTLFPLTVDEFAIFNHNNFHFTSHPDFAETQYLSQYLDEMMIYGSYPGVTLAKSKDKIEELKNIAQNSVIKDIVNIYELRNTDLVYNLLRLLAMQIGNLINITELSSSLGSTKATISNYLSILEKNRIIYRLEPYKSNKRRGYLERKKVFFIDLGIRNAFIDDFRPLTLRQDSGAVFENLVVIGAIRQSDYRKDHCKFYYFREIDGNQKEVDLIIESVNGDKTAFEIKLSGRKINHFPDLGIHTYKSITKENATVLLV